MIVLTATQEQYNSLNGFAQGVSVLEFVKDGLDRWIVGKEVIHNGNFLEIRNQLLELEEVEYVKPIIE
jgi:hypothetical protein